MTQEFNLVQNTALSRSDDSDVGSRESLAHENCKDTSNVGVNELVQVPKRRSNQWTTTPHKG